MENKITIFDVMIALAKKKWFIIIFVGICCIASVTYVLLTPQIWSSNAKFVTVSDDMSASGIGSSMLSNVGLDFLTSQSSGALQNMMYLTSRDLKKKIVKKYNLTEYFEIAEKDSLKAREMTIETLKLKMYSVFYDKKTDIITISFRTKTQEMSRDMVNYVLNELNEYNLNYKKTKGKEKRVFLEKRIDELDTEFEKITDKFIAFQKKTNLYSTDSQIEQQFKIYSELLTKKYENDIALTMIKGTYDEDNPTVKQLQDVKQELNSLIKNIQNGSFEKNAKIMIPFDSIPTNVAQYEIYKMQLEINRKIYEFVYPQYEMAKIEEIKDLPTIDVIQHADLEGLRVYPKRGLICIIVFLVSFMIAAFIVILSSFISTENKQKFNYAWKTFIGKNE